MICVVDASVAVKWFVRGDQLAREDHVEPAMQLLGAAVEGRIDLHQPPHFLAEVAAVLTRIDPRTAQRDLDNLAALEVHWAHPTEAYARAVGLAANLNHHLFDTLYHALALETPGAVFVTADRRYFDKARSKGAIALLADFALP